MILRFAVLTVSDRCSRGERANVSGPALIEIIKAQGWDVTHQDVLPDDLSMLRETLSAWAERGDVDVILTTGGTGFSARDVTPEATRSIIEREAPGLAEAMRAASLSKSPHAMLSRAVSGIH
ncbi:MAG: MogA/MoaB family molybdenum cofactor biosynthesis protein, partial [Chloroflexi bacterium]|nr:MogA/MoaB family molybdenum cofactor biosynthesis protein [Chloroflexota bacterium]